MTATRFDFAFARSYRVPALALGITGSTAWVELGTDGLLVRYGLWRLRTPLANLGEVQRTGGFSWFKTVGPPHLSFADRGVSFATNGDDAVCVQFHEPVRVLDPTGRLRHPGATMTLRDPDRFVAELDDLRGSGRG
ncbi:hypothetical protein [Nocardioides litoris]|uniref:hypothetical protein n=1 Tax=Nocardioides litoris TaxID=1926648 RepID=UPI001122DD08|nr:hypothetical protein [Nocardioides litoris]